MQSSSPWSPVVSGPEDDFSTFLEFGDLQFNFPHFDGNTQDREEIQDGSAGPSMDLQTSNNAAGVMGFSQGDMHHFTDPAVMGDFNGSCNVFSDLDMPLQLFEQQQQPQQMQMQQPPSYGQPYMPRNVTPQTPNSIEMHGGKAQYQPAPPHNHARAMHEHYRYQSNGQTTFTPLVSPAVTPHDGKFRYQDYAVPGEYFSPLTSPALEAQNHASQRSVYSAVRGSDTSDTTSPVDMNIDPSLQPSVLNGTRKPRRKTSNTAQRNHSRTVRQSPSTKPQTRKKQTSSTSIPSNRISEIIEDAGNAKRALNATQHPVEKLPVAISQESSEAESISPESLSEILMPPPATPKSASGSKSPPIVAKPGSQSAPMPPTDNKPVTPASLMRIRKGAGRSAGSALKEQSSRLESQLEQTIEAIVLPDSAKSSSKRPALTPLRTSDATEDDITPTMSARKTPKIAPTAPISAPVTATGSASPSPKSNPMASPNGALPSKRGDIRLSTRQGKKRTKSSSVQISPALRPRISPSIKPLLPEGVVSAETSALLLASKSNYQNLVEGTHLPGVSYPETLSTNLTSKRTSHKLAEQGRRNRINTALQEIASLLPPTPNGPTPKDMTPNGKINSPGASVMLTGTAAQQSNSKASTVESAIDYIKALQGELKDVKARLEVAELKLAGCDGDGNDGMKAMDTNAGKSGNDGN
ncbi:MAG: hypothetical protein LQ343_001948 [Gyalolechia ehrenbergii]|nr:MAG: hypothetical protein LQ343_001948 [Gyalolechia ehrenbergii]